MILLPPTLQTYRASLAHGALTRQEMQFQPVIFFLPFYLWVPSVRLARLLSLLGNALCAACSTDLTILMTETVASVHGTETSRVSLGSAV